MNWWSKTGRRSPPDQKSHPNWVPSLPGSDKKPKSSSKGPGSCYAPWNDKFQPTVNKTVGTSWDHWWKKQKGTPPGPTNHILAILLIFSYFLFYSCCYQWILLEGYVYMYTFHQIHVSISFPLKDLYKNLFQRRYSRGVEQKKDIYIYNATPGGGDEQK